MAKIVTPAIRKFYKEYIKAVIEDLHKPIIAHMSPEKADCPCCIWDSVNGKSSGTFNTSFVSPILIFGKTINPIPFTRGRCPVCHGVGYLTNPVIKRLKAPVRWNPRTNGDFQDFQITPAGREGKAIVRIKVSRKDYETIRDAEYFTVDGVRCELNAPITIRSLGQQEELVVAYLTATEVGSDVKR